jgi:hypothetical protein
MPPIIIIMQIRSVTNMAELLTRWSVKTSMPEISWSETSCLITSLSRDEYRGKVNDQNKRYPKEKTRYPRFLSAVFLIIFSK